MLCVLLKQQQVFFPLLLSDEGLDFYGNEEASHRVYMLNEALDRVNLYWLFIISFFFFFTQPCFKFQFELSSALPFISPGVAAIYTLSFSSSLSDVVPGYQLTSCLPSVRLLKGCGMNHTGAYTSVNMKQTLFFLSLTQNSPLLYLISVHTFHFISDKKQGSIFPLLTS